jgi:hypothetical protein
MEHAGGELAGGYGSEWAWRARRGGRGGRGAASHEMSKLNDRRPVPGACRAREMGLLGSEKGEEEESRRRCSGWI